jgi:hypothetical protein
MGKEAYGLDLFFEILHGHVLVDADLLVILLLAWQIEFHLKQN